MSADRLDLQDLASLANVARLHLCEALVVLEGRDGCTADSPRGRRQVTRREILDALNSINCIDYNIATIRRERASLEESK